MKIKLLFFSCSLIVAIITCCLLIHVQTLYSTKFVYLKDAAELLGNDIMTYVQIPTTSKVELIKEVFASNFRSPIRPIIQLIVHSESLRSPYGHMITTLPFLCIFLFLGAYFIYRCSHSIIIALFFILFFSSFVMVFNNAWGLAVYWLDFHAALLVSSCLIFLYFYQQQLKLKFLVGFALLSSLSFLSRNYSAVYLLFCGGGMLAYILFTNWANRILLLKHYTILAGILLVCIGYFMYTHFISNINYAAELGSGSGQSLKSSVGFFYKAAVQLVGIKTIAVLIIYFIFFAVLFFKRAERKTIWLRVWMAFSPAIFMVIVHRVNGHYMSMYYSLVPLALFSFLPFDLQSDYRLDIRKWVVLALLSSACLLWIAYSNFSELMQEEISEEKRMVNSIVVHLTSSGEDNFSSALGGFSIPEIAIRYYYSSQKLLHTSIVFGKYDLAWLHYYKSKDIGFIKDKYLRDLRSATGLFLVFDDRTAVNKYFDRASKNSPSEIGRGMAIVSLDHIKGSEQWNRIESFSHPLYGEIALYQRVVSNN